MEQSGWDTITKNLQDQSSARNGDNIPVQMIKTEHRNSGVFLGTKTISVSDLEKLGVWSPGMKVPAHNIKESYDGNSVRCYVGKSPDDDGHILVIGGPGSGKSTCIAMPTLETWGGTIFAIDIKGELTDRWRQIRGSKRPEKVFDLTNDSREDSVSYDPFHFLRLESEEDNIVQNAREIAHAIIPLPPDTRDPFWIQSAQQVLTAAILHGVGIGASFNDTMTHILSTPIWDLVEEIGDDTSDNLAAKLHVAQFKGIVDPADSKMLTGISAELNNKIMVFVTNVRIKEAFSPAKDSIQWADLGTCNIFMRIPEDKLGQYDGAISLMLTQLIRSMERRHDKKYADGKPQVLSEHGEVIPPTLLLLDEFPRLGKVDVIQNALSTLRSKGVTICLVMQSLAQLDRIYGKETRQIIVDACQYKAILQVSDPDNQKIVSDMIGSIVVPTRSYSKSLTGIDVMNPNTSYQASESREPIILPYQLATLADVVLLTPKGFCRVNKMPYFNTH